jgi:anti-sigma regulatory factor (Ser/Thr protein kinase)
MTLELHATPEEVMRAVEALHDFAQAQHLPDDTAFALKLALEECGSNIVNHALRRNAGCSFRVTIERAGSEVSIELRDPGPEFNAVTAVGCKRRADEDVRPGGWGLQLVSRYMDEIRYRREGGENVLRLIKRLTPTPSGS